MVEMLGDYYYIDFNALSDFLMSDETFLSGTTNENNRKDYFNENGELISFETSVTLKDKPREINVVRYDIIRGFIDDIGVQEEEDSALGESNLDKMSIRFKIAFNTLLFNKILKAI